MSWQQFSIGDKYPIEEVKNLPDFPVRWHFLFEPQLLVRVEKSVQLPVNAEWGDKAKSSPSKQNGRFFDGEECFYGKDLWEANANFLHANSELVKLLIRQGRNDLDMQRKHVHLLCNQFGMNYWREFLFYSKCAIRSLRLYIERGNV